MNLANVKCAELQKVGGKRGEAKQTRNKGSLWYYFLVGIFLQHLIKMLSDVDVKSGRRGIYQCYHCLYGVHLAVSTRLRKRYYEKVKWRLLIQLVFIGGSGTDRGASCQPRKRY